ncbi:MAG TPA: hypothetical protein VMA75_02460 [Candidatus Paceibacterota bacterium]|nr:hypothetical protein [Candidatus Paceibacterota bacterium]
MTAKKRMTKKKSGNTAKAWEIGGAITAATLAAAASAYLLSDKKTKAKAKKWIVDARKEVAKNVKAAKKVSAKDYARIVDRTMQRYGSVKNMTAADMMAAGKEMKGEWRKIQAHAQRMAKKPAAKKRPAVKKRSAAKKKGPAKKSRA